MRPTESPSDCQAAASPEGLYARFVDFALLAIHDLLDLFRLLVSVDEFSRANGFGVSVLLHRFPDKLVGGGDVWFWLGDQVGNGSLDATN